MKERSYLVIEAKEVRTVKEVVRSDDLWRFACCDVHFIYIFLWYQILPDNLFIFFWMIFPAASAPTIQDIPENTSSYFSGIIVQSEKTTAALSAPIRYVTDRRWHCKYKVDIFFASYRSKCFFIYLLAFWSGSSNFFAFTLVLPAFGCRCIHTVELACGENGSITGQDEKRMWAIEDMNVTSFIETIIMFRDDVWKMWP